MKIAIIGAGAIGGYVGAKLALAGEDVTFIVRGANLEAMRDNGIKLITHDGTEHVASNVKTTNDFAEAGPLEGHLVRSVDPHGKLTKMIPLERVVGCVVYPASELVAPSVVKHIEGDRFPVGELDGTLSERAMRISACFGAAGFKAPVLENIRAEIWLKLWGNLTFNQISGLTGSMLQDIEAGRAPEIDALVGSVVELGRLTQTQTQTPHINTTSALVKLLAQSM
ncbi:MAG: oxidoreductase, partial [Polaromonas sp.]|nr:oxidoreductase [Polaromonas sp.]